MPTVIGASAAVAPAAAAAPVGRLISSDSIPVGGFTPGAMLLDRYRIIGLLGRGGMGEVYRADDLKLGQPVALKFLPRALAADPVRRERFFAEVRITRQLSHPNICRVYDIAEFEGQHFLSMEYIDGEDLASLIKRIGYLSNEKALEVTRQLVAGLAAAHDRGVLHRDLKPANIMIDGHGRVRITDFGLAVAADSETQNAEMFGTPAYMAPEQFSGKGASVRSDIYALGLVLYEIYCGKRAFSGTTLAEMRDEKERLTPRAPSEVRAGIDPVVERLILRSMERDPRLRPASAAQLAAALPGGDPLAAAIAAGETPSPEMVAAAGLHEGLRPVVAIALAAIVVAGSIVAMAMNSRTKLIESVKMDKPPDVLIDRAREVIRKAGYTAAPADAAYGFDVDSDMLTYFEQKDKTKSRWEQLKTTNPVYFWYRESPRPLEHLGAAGTVTPSDPPMQFSGEVLLRLDAEGRLRTFQAMPPQRDSGSDVPSVDWSPLFAQAGVDLTRWKEAKPERNPLYYADTHTAWQGSLADAPGIPLRVEAAAYGGNPVSFEVAGPWTRADRMSSSPVSRQNRILHGLSLLLLASVVSGALFFARRNLRLGRGDRRGATRLALFVMGSYLVAWVAREHHVSDAWEGYLLVFGGLGWAVPFAALNWCLYIALEPFVRRRWPQVLISWTRLWSGQLVDPLVGRHILVGCAAGVVLACLNNLFSIAPPWFGYPEPIPTNAIVQDLAHPASWIGLLVPIGGINFSVLTLFLLFLLRVLLRSERLAAAVLAVVVVSIAAFSAATPWVAAPLLLAFVGLHIFVIIQFGLLAAIAEWYVFVIFLNFPMTLNTSAWYSGIGFAGLSAIIALTLYGLRTSLGGRPLIQMANADD